MDCMIKHEYRIIDPITGAVYLTAQGNFAERAIRETYKELLFRMYVDGEGGEDVLEVQQVIYLPDEPMKWASVSLDELKGAFIHE